MKFGLVLGIFFFTSISAEADWGSWKKALEIDQSSVYSANLLSINWGNPSVPAQSAPATVPTVAFASPGVLLPTQQCDYRIKISDSSTNTTEYFYPNFIKKSPNAAISRNLEMKFAASETDTNPMFHIRSITFKFLGTGASGELYDNLVATVREFVMNLPNTGTVTYPNYISAKYSLEQRCYTAPPVPAPVQASAIGPDLSVSK